ncbi:hypothetical protein Dsin_004285 [Dipteronia sinensis]|uniref:RRM domain-containing protein n=1 Tax=Dipteronia sinensis TaxID=43782 RepID=A0AAE0ELG9_9ROSI|nr:hypothetical protein Dsin_004285 [Dipteronia sinensis]
MVAEKYSGSNSAVCEKVREIAICEDSAQTAINAMDGHKLNGRSIRVSFTNKRPSDPRSYSSGGGGGYRGNLGGYGNDNKGSSY